VVESDGDKANAFNKFFVGVFTVEDYSLLPMFSINIDAPVLDDVPISPEVMYAKLNKSNPNKAVSPHQKSSRKWCTPLTILFSKVFKFIYSTNFNEKRSCCAYPLERCPPSS